MSVRGDGAWCIYSNDKIKPHLIEEEEKILLFIMPKWKNIFIRGNSNSAYAKKKYEF